jgi:protein-S-isoprenylcysteine O-methyltransferase Ste14
MEKTLVPIIMLSFMVAAILPRIIQKLRKIDPVGSIGIDKRLFAAGKLALFGSLVMVPLHTFVANLSFVGQQDVLKWIGLALLGFGSALFVFATISLGAVSLRMGLAKEKTVLRTSGIYTVSRNPMLLGIMIMVVGSGFYVPSPVNWALGILVIAVHHRIILAEEQFMRKQFGRGWIEYSGRVGRYLG